MSKVICSRGYPCAKDESEQGGWLGALHNAMAEVVLSRKHLQIPRKPAPTSFRHLKLRVVDAYWTCIEVTRRGFFWPMESLHGLRNWATIPSSAALLAGRPSTKWPLKAEHSATFAYPFAQSGENLEAHALQRAEARPPNFGFKS
jgi:hypothetical protein